MPRNTATEYALPDINFDRSSLPLTFRGLGKSAYTLFFTPPHMKLHQPAEARALQQEPQPPQPTIEDVCLKTTSVLASADELLPPPLDIHRLTQLGSLLIQFSDHVPRFHASVKIPYEAVQKLHSAITERAEITGPLDFADQLQISLELSSGNLSKALWNLFITSRLHARWLDESIIDGLPQMTEEEKVDQMLSWRSALAACKSLDENPIQDTAGDTYYTWTHALAKYIYSLATKDDSKTAAATVKAFHHGTTIMHTAVHRINKQGLHSDHSIAAEYGNRIGQTCVDYIQGKSSEIGITSDAEKDYQEIVVNKRKNKPLVLRTLGKLTIDTVKLILQREKLFHLEDAMYEGCREIAEYAHKEGIENIILVDKSARPLWVGISQYWEHAFGDKPKPTFHFLNPSFLKSSTESSSDPDNLQQRIQEAAQLYISSLLRSRSKLVQERDSPLLLVDSCLHSGRAVKLTKRMLESADFSDIRIGIVRSTLPKSSGLSLDVLGVKNTLSANCIRSEEGSNLVRNKVSSPFSERVGDRTANSEGVKIRREIRAKISAKFTKHKTT